MLHSSQAEEQRPLLRFAVVRVPFLLEPNYDESVAHIETNRERLLRKWGGVEGWRRQKAAHDLKGRGIDAGIPHFNLDRLASNSMASHRLVQYVAKTFGLEKSEELYDQLNVYHFVNGFALNDKPHLAKLTHDILPQWSEHDILTFLDSDNGRPEITSTLNMLQQMGIHGIPKFIIEGQTIVDGAAQSDVFLNVFRDIVSRGSVARGPIFADMLGISPEIITRGSHGLKISNMSS